MNCTKSSFRTERDAQQYIDKLVRTSIRKTVPCRAYLCPHCLLWHLSSHEQNAPLKKHLAELQDEIKQLKHTINTFNSSEAKEFRNFQKRDKLIIQLKQQLERAADTIKRLRADKNQLITQLLKQQ